MKIRKIVTVVEENGYGATGGGTLELAVEARRRETDADPTVPMEHTAAVRVTSRF